MPVTAGEAFKGTAKWLSATAGIIVMVVIVVGVASAGVYVGEAMLDRLFPEWRTVIGDREAETTSGRIFVDSPEVYTRERLVNDRLQHATWLERQLRATEGILENEGSFQSIEGQILSSQRNLTGLGLGVHASSRNKGNSEKDTKENIGEKGESDNKPKAQNDNGRSFGGERKLSSPIKPTSSDLFRAMADYRELVRAELMQTQLDDRHDIEGNTLYRLTFDTSVVHGNNTSKVAVVKVRVRHDAAEWNDYQRLCSHTDPDEVNCKSYRRAYEDWIAHLEKIANEWSDQRAKVMLQGHLFADAARVEIYQYLRRCIERRLLIISSIYRRMDTRQRDCAQPDLMRTEATLDRDSTSRPSTNLPPVDGFIRNYTKRYIESFSRAERIRYAIELVRRGATVDFRDDQKYLRYMVNNNRSTKNEHTIDKNNAHGIKPNTNRIEQDKNTPKPNTDPIDFGTARSFCPKSSIVRDQFRKSEPPTFNLPVKENSVLYNQIKTLESQAPGKVRKQPSLTLPCPPIEFERSVINFYAVVDLYYRMGLWMQRLAGGNAAGQPPPSESELKSLTFYERGVLKECPENNGRESLLVGDNKFQWVCAVERPKIETAREIATGYQGEKLLSDFPRIKGLIKVGLVGCGIGSCRLAVTPPGRWIKYDARWGGRNSPHREYLESLRLFAYRLNDNVEVYSYGVTPKNLRQRFATSFGSSDLLRIMTAGSAGLGDKDVEARLKRVEEHLDDIEFIQGFPIVVGFGSVEIYGDEASNDNLSKHTDFGWIIAPQPRGRKRGANEFWQPHQQYSLSAVLSLPSWWKNIKLEVVGCWRDLRNGEIQDDSVFQVCGTGQEEKASSTFRREYVIKLPGDYKEITRKLRVDVFEEPRLITQGAARLGGEMLRIGHPGKLLIPGSRLWRSTKVTLGSQVAEKVLVLPNMEGVIAEFDCIGRPAQRPAQFPPTNWRRGPASAQTSPSPSAPGPNLLVYDADLLVWTSEGVTQNHIVKLVEPENLDDQRPCDDRGPASGDRRRAHTYKDFLSRITNDRLKDQAQPPSPPPAPAPKQAGKPAEAPRAKMSPTGRKAPGTAEPAGPAE